MIEYIPHAVAGVSLIISLLCMRRLRHLARGYESLSDWVSNRDRDLQTAARKRQEQTKADPELVEHIRKKITGPAGRELLKLDPDAHAEYTKRLKALTSGD